MVQSSPGLTALRDGASGDSTLSLAAQPAGVELDGYDYGYGYDYDYDSEGTTTPRDDVYDNDSEGTTTPLDDDYDYVSEDKIGPLDPSAPILDPPALIPDPPTPTADPPTPTADPPTPSMLPPPLTSTFLPPVVEASSAGITTGMNACGTVVTAAVALLAARLR
eukprot:jgi/Ulvmu1/2072/UM123_0004.1